MMPLNPKYKRWDQGTIRDARRQQVNMEYLHLKTSRLAHKNCTTWQAQDFLHLVPREVLHMLHILVNQHDAPLISTSLAEMASPGGRGAEVTPDA